MRLVTRAAVALLFALVVAQGPAQATTDRAVVDAAKRYMEVSRSTEMLDKMIAEISKQLPPEVRDQFAEHMRGVLDPVWFEATMLEVLVKYLSEEELTALADFYATPVGQSVLSKMPQMMGEVMPQIQGHVLQETQTFITKKQNGEL